MALSISELFEQSAQDNWTDLLREYLAAGGDPNGVRNTLRWSLLHMAVEQCNAAAVEVLVQHGADIEARTQDGWTPLHLAVDSEIDGARQTGGPLTFKVVKRLVQLGADVNALTETGIAPGDIAGEYGADERAQFELAITNKA